MDDRRDVARRVLTSDAPTIGSTTDNRHDAFVDWAWNGFMKTGGPHVLDRSAAAAIDWDDDEAVAAPAAAHSRAG